MSDRNSLLLKGLDGSNPLAFLAALGAAAHPDAGAAGRNGENELGAGRQAWRPRLHTTATKKNLVSTFSTVLSSERSSHATAFVGDADKIASFYANSRQCLPVSGELDHWIAALTNDVRPNATSQLQLTRRDYFAGNLEQIIAKTTPELLEKSLFESWHYDDMLEGQSLHLEPTEDRRYAYQWDQPSGDPNRKTIGNMLGANRLAIEAFPLFLGLPSRKNPDRLLVSGWSGVRSDDSRWTWPIWSAAISLHVVRSVIALQALQLDRISIDHLRGLGISAAFRCRRILVEKTPNLTPAVAMG